MFTASRHAYIPTNGILPHPRVRIVRTSLIAHGMRVFTNYVLLPSSQLRVRNRDRTQFLQYPTHCRLTITDETDATRALTVKICYSRMCRDSSEAGATVWWPFSAPCPTPSSRPVSIDLSLQRLPAMPPSSNPFPQNARPSLDASTHQRYNPLKLVGKAVVSIEFVDDLAIDGLFHRVRAVRERKRPLHPAHTTVGAEFR